MEFEQLVKRIEWLDEEHRKTRAVITRLEERMATLEANIDTVAKPLKPLPKQIADIASTTTRLDQFDGIFAKQHDDMKQAIDEIEKRHQKRGPRNYQAAPRRPGALSPGDGRIETQDRKRISAHRA